MTPDDWVVRGAKFANNVIREWMTDEKMFGMKPSDLKPKFQQSIKAFEAAASVGEQHLAQLNKEIKFYQDQLKVIGKRMEIDQELATIASVSGEPKRGEVAVGDVIMLLVDVSITQSSGQKVGFFEKGTMADVIKVSPNANKITVLEHKGQKELALKLNQFKLMGAKSIDLKFEKKVASLVGKAIACNRNEDAVELIGIAQDLPYDPSQSLDEAHDDTDDDAEGWISRRQKFFADHLTGAVSERIRKLETSTDAATY
jgi:hypothetical protein